jgi:hypothetical protein
MKLPWQPILVVILSLALGACAGIRDPEIHRAPEQPVTHVNVGDFEDFDASPYREEVARVAVVQHDVPSRLMDGEAPRTTTRTVQGFRIQVLSSVDKAEADRAVDEAMSWWSANRGEAPQGLFGSQLPVYVVYQQPYYRVRIGNFATRADAQRRLDFVRRQYPGAFLAPDTVTITN